MILTLLSTFCFTNCESWNLNKIDIIELNTLELDMDSIFINQAKVVSEVKGINQTLLSQHGHLWSASNSEPTIQSKDGIDYLGGKDIDGNFQTIILGLKKNTNYYVRAFAEIDDQVIYGTSTKFTTNRIHVFTDSISYFSADTARLYGRFSAFLEASENIEEEVRIDQSGFCWSTTDASPTLENGQSIISGIDTKDTLFTAKIQDIKDSTTYYFRSYVIANFGADTVYADEAIIWDSQLTNIWFKKNDFPYTTNNAYRSFSFNSRGYVYTEQQQLELYDPQTDSWTSSSKSPGFLYNTTNFEIGNNAFFMLTGDGNSVGDVLCYKYDLINDSWTQLKNFPGIPSIQKHGFAPGNGKAYVGIDANFWEYDPASDQWTKLINTYPKDEFSFSQFAFVVDGHAYIAGGTGAGDENILFRYNHEDNSWLTLGDLPTQSMYSNVFFTINQIVYVGTGNNDGESFSRRFWAYDYKTNIWTEIPDLPGPKRVSAFGFAIGDFGFVGGGKEPGQNLKDFWKFKQ